MWSALIELAVVLLAAWFVWRLIALRLKLPGQAAEPGPSRDDYAGVPSRLRPRPKFGAGAVALAEPDEDSSLSAVGRYLPKGP